MKQDLFDIVVIGAGVIGHSIAFRLGQIRPELSLAVPFGECDKADSFFKFCRESLLKYPSFIKDLTSVSGVPVYLSMAGSLMPSSSFEGEWEERVRFFREENIPHEIWSSKRCRQLAPALAESCGEVMWASAHSYCKQKEIQSAQIRQPLHHRSYEF